MSNLDRSFNLRWLGLGVLLLGTFLPPLDFFIVNVSLPSIKDSLGLSSGMAQLVISGYAEAYAVFLITGGRLGDIFGRKRVFISGMIGFAIASAVCGFANAPFVLVAGRVLQGICAAVLAPQSLASIHALFHADEKPKALRLYGATFGLASMAGQILGGVLISLNPFGLGWRSIFIINLPVIVLAIPMAVLVIKENRPPRPPKLDFVGCGLLALGLSALIIPLIEGRERGWPTWSVLSLVMAAPLLHMFWRHENRVVQQGGDPLVVPSLFRVPGLRRGLASALCFYAMAAFFLTFAVYRQSGLGNTPLQSGLAVLPLAIGFFVGPFASPILVRRCGSATPTIGMGLEVVGLLVTAACAAFRWDSCTPSALFVIGFGQGVALPTLVRAIITCVDAQWSGLAAGLINSTLQVSAALAVAIIGGIFYAIIGPASSPGPVREAFTVAVLCVSVSLAAAAYLASAPGKLPPNLR